MTPVIILAPIVVAVVAFGLVGIYREFKKTRASLKEALDRASKYSWHELVVITKIAGLKGTLCQARPDHNNPGQHEFYVHWDHGWDSWIAEKHLTRPGQVRLTKAD